jgi:hypothetical protein
MACFGSVASPRRSPALQLPAKDSARLANRPIRRPSPSAAAWSESEEDRDRRLIELLGEVIRMSKA